MLKQFAAALIAGLAFAGAANAADPLPDLKGRTIVAVAADDYPPLNFEEVEGGKGIGLEYDLVNEIAKRLNAKVDWKKGSWDTMIEDVRQGTYDVGMDGISITDERKQQIDFTDSYLLSQQFLLVRADETRFTDAKTLAAGDFLIGAQTGTTNFYTALDVTGTTEDDPSPKIKLFDTFGATVAALKAGDVDAVFMDNASAAGYMGASPNAFKITGDPIGNDQFGFILKKGSDLVAPFNAAIASIKADGTLDALNKKWFYDYSNK
ncbi:MAG TPA: transporter substrate-binding domain-containing protein [Bauldia sp.]|nr:transporter substrate-binding domain-containing protein [Bauldia sp.]